MTYIKLETIGKMGDMISHLEQQNELLQKKLDIATKALKKIIRDYEINGIGYLCVTRAKEALKEIDLVGTSAKESK